jgi:NAD-dependent deacetylase
MFTKTFFSRLKAANDVTVLTGPGVNLKSKIPLFKGQDVTDTGYLPSDLLSKSNFLSNTDLAQEWLHWRDTELKKVKPSLAHYALIDIASKLSNLHIITLNNDGLHHKATSENIIELNGNVFNETTENGHKIPSIRWQGSSLIASAMSKANEVSAICEMFIMIGCGTLKSEESVYPFLAKGNGCFMVEISEKETDMTRHCNEKFIGDIHDFLPKLALIIQKVF